MDAGKLNTRVEVITQTKTADGYGGYTASETVSTTVWANVKESKGDVEGDSFRRGRYLNLDITMRDKTVEDNSIDDNSILKIQSKTGKYQIKGIYESLESKFVKISATKID